MSHHESIKIGNLYVGHAHITNEGVILSIYIKTKSQHRLFLPEDGVLGIIVREEE